MHGKFFRGSRVCDERGFQAKHGSFLADSFTEKQFKSYYLTIFDIQKDTV